MARSSRFTNVCSSVVVWLIPDNRERIRTPRSAILSFAFFVTKAIPSLMSISCSKLSSCIPAQRFAHRVPHCEQLFHREIPLIDVEVQLDAFDDGESRPQFRGKLRAR